MPKPVLVACAVVLGVGLLGSVEPARSAGKDAAAGVAAAGAEHQSANPLTLTEALRRTLARSPELEIYASEVEAREGDLTQAGMYPNPEMSVEFENFAGSGAFSGTDRAETTALLSQRIELGGKRSQRVAVSALDKQIAQREYHEARTALRAQTRRFFIAVLVAQERLALTEDQARLADQVLATVDQRIASGKAPEVQRLHFASLRVETELRREQARRELLAARTALAALWGADQADFERVQGELQELPVIPEWAALVEMIEKSPHIGRQTAVIERAARTIALERALGTPDLTLSVGGKNFEESGDQALVAGLSIALPLFDRNQGALAAAKARAAKARSALRTTELRLRTELGALWQRLQVTRNEANLLQEKLLPTLRQGFEATSYGYRAGKFGYLEVLEAEQRLFAARQRYIDTLKNFHDTRAGLEALLGRDVFANDDEAVASLIQ